MIEYIRAASVRDLEGILVLQKQNLPSALTTEEIQSQGFLTVIHSLEELKKLNEIEPHIIAKENGVVVAYLLAMTARSENDLPVLQPMFQMFRRVSFAGQPIASYNYLVVGQVCVAKSHRGQGVLDGCYSFYRETFKQQYHFAITEIANSNLRSQRAHKRIGFDEIHRFVAPDGVAWSIVVWDWNHLANTHAQSKS